MTIDPQTHLFDGLYEAYQFIQNCLVSEDGHQLSVARFVNFQNAYQKPSISVFIEPSIITVDEWFTNQPTYTT